MIENEQVWMKNVTWLNDSSEIAQGTMCLDAALKSDGAAELASILDGRFAKFTAESHGIPQLMDTAFRGGNVHHLLD